MSRDVRYQNGRGCALFLLLVLVCNLLLLNGCAGIVSSASNNSASPSSLAITSSTLPSGTVQSTYQGQLTAAGGVAPLKWSLAAGTLPVGLSLNTSTGVIGGMPSTSGQTAFTVQVADSSATAQTASKNLSIAISSAGVQITTSSLAGGQVNTNYSATLTASGGATPYTWSITSGSLPAGLSLSSGGQISGKPTQSGTSSFSVQVSDSSSPAQTGAKSLSIAVGGSGSNTVQITTSSLPGGQVNVNYLATLAASGGTTPYNWSIASGSLPGGLTLSSSGQIKGTPTQSGTSSFTALLSDSSSPAQTASRVYSIAISTAGAGMPLTSCQVLANTGTTYVLQNDVSSQGSCFNIQANNITISLNGHTITYADPLSTTLSTAPLTSAAFGIYGAASWDHNFNGGIATGNSTGGSWNNLSVAGPGTITQGSCLSPSDGSIGSNAIHLGQSSGDGLSVFNVTFNICADSTQAIFADANGAGYAVHDNIVNDRVVTAQKRSSYQGIAFVCDGCQNDNGPTSYFYNNTIIGGPQGGISWNNPGVVIYNNTIKHGNPKAAPGFINGGTPSLVCGGLNANPYTNITGATPIGAGTQCTNDFGIFNQSPNAQIYGNTVQALEGRGVMIGGACFSPGSCTGLSGQVLHDDVVTAQEFPNNSEYQGCQIGGAWGLEWRDGPVNSTIYNEKITAISNQCAAGAFRTQYVSNYNNVSHDNVYTAKRAPGSSSNCGGSFNSNLNCAYAADFFGAGNASIPTQFTSRNDTFIADSALLFFDWDASPNQGLLLSPTFQKGSNPDPSYFHFAVFRNGNGTVAMHVRDAVFGAGVSPTDTDLPAQGANQMASSLYIDWTLTLTVHNSGGNPVSGASVAYTNARGTQECSATTNGSGVATCVLTQYRDHNDTGANQIESHNPFSFRISAPACTTLTGNEAITGTTSEIKTLSGC